MTESYLELTISSFVRAELQEHDPKTFSDAKFGAKFKLLTILKYSIYDRSYII